MTRETFSRKKTGIAIKDAISTWMIRLPDPGSRYAIMTLYKATTPDAIKDESDGGYGTRCVSTTLPTRQPRHQ